MLLLRTSEPHTPCPCPTQGMGWVVEGHAQVAARGRPVRGTEPAAASRQTVASGTEARPLGGTLGPHGTVHGGLEDQGRGHHHDPREETSCVSGSSCWTEPADVWTPWTPDRVSHGETALWSPKRTPALCNVPTVHSGQQWSPPYLSPCPALLMPGSTNPPHPCSRVWGCSRGLPSCPLLCVILTPLELCSRGAMRRGQGTPPDRQPAARHGAQPSPGAAVRLPREPY